MPITVEMPNDINSWFNPIIEKAIPADQSTVNTVYQIITDKALFDNKDVNDSTMLYKKDTSRYPDQLIETGKMSQRDLWELGEKTENGVEVIYRTSEIIDKWGRAYMDYLTTKDPEDGGRPWILENKINNSAIEEIQNWIIENVNGEEYAD